jgi:hypothetical protein
MADNFWNEEDIWWEMQDPPWVGFKECDPSDIDQEHAQACLSVPFLGHEEAIQCEDQESAGATGPVLQLAGSDSKSLGRIVASKKAPSSFICSIQLSYLKNLEEKSEVNAGRRHLDPFGYSDDCSDDFSNDGKMGLPSSSQCSYPTLGKGKSGKRTSKVPTNSSQEEQRQRAKSSRVMTVQDVEMRSAVCTSKGKVKAYTATSGILRKPYTDSPLDIIPLLLPMHNQKALTIAS